MNTKTPSDPLLIGIDVGTTNIKALIFDPSRSRNRPRTGQNAHTPSTDRMGVLQTAMKLWETVCSVLKDTVTQLDNPANITGIATASIGETGIPIDKRGKPTSPAIAWFDQRTRPQCEQLQKIFDRDELFSLTGLPLQPISGLCKILWIREQHPEAFARTTTWLNTADYIAFRLSGIPATDYSLASRTLAFDLHRRQWANDLLSEVRLSPNLFAPLCTAGTDLGPILPDIAREIGLPLHTRICAGGHDHILRRTCRWRYRAGNNAQFSGHRRSYVPAHFPAAYRPANRPPELHHRRTCRARSILLPRRIVHKRCEHRVVSQFI